MNHQLYKRPDVGTGIEFVIFVHCLQHEELHPRFLCSSVLKHSHETISLEEKIFFWRGKLIDPLWSLFSFHEIYTGYCKDRGSRWLRWVFFTHSFQSGSNVTSSWALSANLNTAMERDSISLFNFSFVHSSKAGHEHLPASSPQSLLQILCSVLTELERKVMLFRRYKTGKWVDGREALQVSCWGKAQCSPQEVEAPESMHELVEGPRATGNQASLLVQTYCWQQRKDNSSFKR